MTVTTIAPEVLWAQRSSDLDFTKNVIFLTINAPELEPDYQLDITASKLTFKGVTKAAAGSLPHRQYAFDLELFGEIEPESAKKSEHLTGKSLSLVLKKKELKEDYWPRLSKDKRVNFIKTDFFKWKDQDEQMEGEDDADLGGGMDGMPGMGGMGGMGGMPGMGGMGGMPDMSSMMGGMGGSGGMDFEKMMAQMKDMPGGGGLGDGDDDDDLAVGGSGAGDDDDLAVGGSGAGDDDEDMPPLESS